MFRCSRDFKRAKTFKILYCSLVRSTLEYASQVWNPRYKCYVTRLENIQKKFLKFLCFKLGIRFDSNKYLDLCRRFHLLPLETRRNIADITYLLKVASNLIDSPTLLGKLNIRIPSRARRKPPLSVPLSSTNYRQNSFLIRASNGLNEVFQRFDDLDLFSASVPLVRRRLSRQFFGRGREMV